MRDIEAPAGTPQCAFTAGGEVAAHGEDLHVDAERSATRFLAGTSGAFSLRRRQELAEAALASLDLCAEAFRVHEGAAVSGA